MNLQTPPPIAAEIDFTLGGNLGRFQHHGFSVPEPSGTWAIGTESVIFLDPLQEREPVRLELLVQGFLHPGLITSQTMTVLINGVEIGKISVEDRNWTQVSFDVPSHAVAHEGPLRLNFIHRTPVAPVATGDSSDARLLSFMFLRLKVFGTGRVQAPRAQLSQPSPPVAAHAPRVERESEVHLGHDGWLFLTGGSNSVLRYYQDPAYFDDYHCARWADLLIARATRLTAQGIRYLHIAAPDKISVYPELLRLNLNNLERHPIALLAAELRRRGQDDLLINPLPAFREHPERERLYLKTDTHWTYRAGQLVLEMVCRRLGKHRRLDLSSRTMKFYSHVWDLGSKVQPQIPEQNYAVTTSRFVTRTHENELARAFRENIRDGKPVTHGSIYVSFQNTDPSALDEVVVIFGDSFMDFQDSNTSIIFAETFREVHFVWSPNVDFDFVRKVGASLVITELAERFMISMPDDHYEVVI